MGRPKSKKQKQIAVSMTQELRGILQKAADQAGHSLAEEVRRRLWSSFGGQEAVRYEKAWNEQAPHP